MAPPPIVKVKVKERIVLREIHLRTTGRHLSMGSHGVICHPTDWAGWYSIYRPRKDEGLSWPSWLVTYRNGLPVHRRSRLWSQTSNCSLLLIYRPVKDEKMSWPDWRTYSGRFTHINGHPSAIGRAQDRESSPIKDRRSTTEPLYHATKKLT